MSETSTFVWLGVLLSVIVVAIMGRRLLSVFLSHKKDAAVTGLHMKLVFLFGFVSLVPAVFMAFFSLFFFHYGVESWFGQQIKTSVVESNSIAESYLKEHQSTIRADILAMANDLDRQYNIFVDNDGALKRMINTQIFYRNLSEAVLMDSQKRVLAFSGVELPDIEYVSEYDFDRTQQGEVVVGSQQDGDRVYALARLENFEGDQFLLVGRPVDATVLARVQQTREASKYYLSLEGQSGAIRFKVIIAYVVLSICLVLASIWFALYIAKSFIRPVEALVDASNRVRAGDLDIELHESTGVAELDQLTQAYNRMTSRLSKQRHDLVSANRQLDERRMFIETILGGVSSGVLSVDHLGVIKLSNRAARAILLGKDDVEGLDGKHVNAVIVGMDDTLNDVFSYIGNSEGNFQVEIPYFDGKGLKRDLLLRVVPEMFRGENIGAIVTFDDITNLKNAERSAAWSDVARRIAHEIKNPLTPIQLSAERLQKKFIEYVPEKDQEIFRTCVETISRHVSDIGGMVSEFSSFARMPEPKMNRVDIVSLIKQCSILHQESEATVTIELFGGLKESTPVYVQVDEQQVRQAYINILQNAMDSAKGKDFSFVGVWLVIREGEICLIVRDSGEGFPENVIPESCLEPYITNKEHGTGLGLAIVKKIIGDHSGEIILGVKDWMLELDSWEDLSEQGVRGAIVSLIFPSVYNNNGEHKES